MIIILGYIPIIRRVLGILLLMMAVNLYWLLLRPIRAHSMTYIGRWLNQYETVASESFPLLIIVLRHRVLSSLIMPLRRDTQAPRFIGSIPLISQRKKCHSREEKSAFP